MIAQGLVVFAATFVLDIVWARYATAVTDRRRLAASVLAALIILIGGYTTINYVNDAWMLLPAMAGAFAGTYVGIKL